MVKIPMDFIDSTFALSTLANESLPSGLDKFNHKESYPELAES
jgi:hypothetical protein